MLNSEINSPQINSPGALNIEMPRNKPGQTRPAEKTEPSSIIIFSIVNSTIGSNIILLPLSIASSGIGTSIIVAIVIGIVSYRTCQLTHLHSKPDEIEYIATIHRIMGKAWMYVYSANSIIILFICCMIYFLSLSDVTYSCLKLISRSTDWPDRDTITFSSFSFQYTGIIVMALVSWVFFISKLDLIVEIAGKGIYSVIVESIFVIYIGIKAIVSGDVHFAFSTDKPEEEIGLFTSSSFTKTIGVFAMAFLVHNSIVELLKKSRNPEKNCRDVRISYTITFFIYTVIGSLGALGIYNKMGANPNTVLSNELYGDSINFTTIFLIITQIMTCFQLMTVLAVNNNIFRIQFFILILGENKTPPKFATLAFNIVFIGILLFVQILNIKPNVIMSYGGAIFGFVIIYLLPIMIHLKEIRARQVEDHHKYAYLHGEHGDHHHHEDTHDSQHHEEKHDDQHHEEKHDEHHHEHHEVEITKFIKEKQKVNFVLEYSAHGVIMAVGVYILIAQIISFF